MAIRFNVVQIGLKVTGLGVGAVGARLLGKLPMVNNLPPLVQGIIKIGVGALIPILINKGKDKANIVSYIGDGIASAGAVELAGNFIPQVAGIMGEDDNSMYGVGLLDNQDYTVQGVDDEVYGMNDGEVINGSGEDVTN